MLNSSSMQAENLMKSAVEEYKEIVKEVKATDANLTIIRNIRINIQGKPRRLVDIADLKKTDDVHKLQLLVLIQIILNFSRSKLMNSNSHTKLMVNL